MVHDVEKRFRALVEQRNRDMDKIRRSLDRSAEADAARFRWIADGNGYILEEWGEPGGQSPEEQDEVRVLIDYFRGGGR